MSTAISPSVSSFLRVVALSVLACAASLGFVTYQAMANPAQAGWLMSAAPMVPLLAMLAILVVLATKGLEVPERPRSMPFAALVVGFGLCFVLGWNTIVLAGSQRLATAARANLDGRTPALAEAAAAQLRARPWALWPAMRTLRPTVTGAWANPADVALFQQAHAAGLRSPEIAHVMANGFTRPGDDQALLKAVVAAYAADRSDQPALARLMARLAQ